MKYAKLLGLAALAAAALMAFAGTAAATTLTSPSGTVYTGEIKAETENGTTLRSSFIGSIECERSTMRFKVENHGSGVTASGKLAEFTLTGCSSGSPTSPVAKPGSLEIHSTATTGNGTVTWSGAEIIWHNTLVGSCTYATSNTDIGTLTGSNVTGSNATLDVNSVALRTSGSGFCGETVTWTASYKITSPSTLEVH